jgi:hypothetical protein
VKQVRDGRVSIRRRRRSQGRSGPPSLKGRTKVHSGTTSESPIVIGSPVRHNLGIGRWCAGRMSPGSTCSAGKPEKVHFTGLLEHQPGSAGWIGSNSDAGLDPKC